MITYLGMSSFGTYLGMKDAKYHGYSTNPDNSMNFQFMILKL